MNHLPLFHNAKFLLRVFFAILSWNPMLIASYKLITYQWMILTAWLHSVTFRCCLLPLHCGSKKQLCWNKLPLVLYIHRLRETFVSCLHQNCSNCCIFFVKFSKNSQIWNVFTFLNNYCFFLLINIILSLPCNSYTSSWRSVQLWYFKKLVHDKTSALTIYTPILNPHRCQINIQTGAALNPRDDVTLHISIRPNESAIVRNTLQNQVWGAEERYGGCPISYGQSFDVLVLVEVNQYKIAINGVHFCTFNHRLPVHSARYISISGGCVIHSILSEMDTSGGSVPPYPGTAGSGKYRRFLIGWTICVFICAKAVFIAYYT